MTQYITAIHHSKKAEPLFKPMLASDADLSTLRFPLLASPKLDGVRAIVRGGVVYSRSNKPIPNRFVQLELGGFEYFDGELIVGEPTSKSAYRDTVSHVMSHNKMNYDLRFYVFDHVEFPAATYEYRASLLNGYSNVHPQQVIHHCEELLTFEEACLEAGYEGLILRDPYAAYKMGRSTTKEQILLKLKRMATDEAVIIGFEEREENTNEKTTNELGRGQRSSHQAGKVGRGDLGALIVKWGEVTFNIGTGFSDAERTEIWTHKNIWLGRLISFNHFPIGVKDKPRHPSWKGIRDPIDT